MKKRGLFKRVRVILVWRIFSILEKVLNDLKKKQFNIINTVKEDVFM